MKNVRKQVFNRVGEQVLELVRDKMSLDCQIDVMSVWSDVPGKVQFTTQERFKSYEER